MESSSKRVRFCNDNDLYFQDDSKIATPYKMYQWQVNYKNWDAYMNAPMHTSNLEDKQYITNINGMPYIVYYPNLTYRQYIHNLYNPYMWPIREYQKRIARQTFLI